MAPGARFVLLFVVLALAAPALPAAAQEIPGCGPGSAPACPARTLEADAFMAGRVSGGSYGFHLTRVGGPVLASRHAHDPFYPASSIKVLHHVTALRWAYAQPDPATALGTAVPVYQDTCSGAGLADPRPLREVLTAMMQVSDNQATNAVQDFFGPAAINLTASDLIGTGDGTFLAHRFGCGGPANNPANRATAADLALVYARYGEGALFDAAAARDFSGFMLGKETGILDGAVGREAAALGSSPAAVARFMGEVAVIYKEGWWETNLSIGAHVSVTTRVCSGRRTAGYAVSVFTDRVDSVAPGFGPDVMVGELLRPEIRTALASYDPDRPLCLSAWTPQAV